MVGADFGLVEQRRDKAVALAAVLHAFADRVDAAVIGLHGVGDDDAALAIEPGLPGELETGLDADRHDDDACRQFGAVLETYAGDVILAEDRLGLRRHLEHHAALFQRLAQQAAGHRIELALHQRVEQMHDGDGHAALHQPVGGFEAQEAAADHHRMAACGGDLDHVLDVLDVAKADDALQLVT